MNTVLNAPETLQEIEIDLLLEGIFRRYGYEFRQYSRASIIRRLEKFLADQNMSTLSSLQDQILHSEHAMNSLIDALSVNVTSMFRNAEFFRAFRKSAIPRLRTYPYLRFWVAGCATGQEAYSLAIILHEAGLLKRSRIYATDFSNSNIKRAKAGIYPLKSMIDYTRNYIDAGGQSDFSEYYSAKYESVKMREYLSENISFAQHNLVSDKSFNEFHVILCRNVMIYFDQSLQEHVMHLFHESLSPFGFLCLGAKEAIFPTNYRDQFQELGEGTRLFQLQH